MMEERLFGMFLAFLYNFSVTGARDSLAVLKMLSS